MGTPAESRAQRFWVGAALAPPVCACSVAPPGEPSVDSASPVYRAVRNPDLDRQSCGSSMQSRSFQVLAHMTGTRTGEGPHSPGPPFDLPLSLPPRPTRRCSLAPPLLCSSLRTAGGGGGAEEEQVGWPAPDRPCRLPTGHVLTEALSLPSKQIQYRGCCNELVFPAGGALTRGNSRNLHEAPGQTWWSWWGGGGSLYPSSALLREGALSIYLIIPPLSTINGLHPQQPPRGRAAPPEPGRIETVQMQTRPESSSSSLLLKTSE